jgi:hypothetical protein
VHLRVDGTAHQLRRPPGRGKSLKGKDLGPPRKSSRISRD